MKTTARDEAQFINRTVLASAISALLAGGGAAQAQESGLEEITVTGSRIVRRDLDSSSPIVTVDTEQLENTSTVGIESVLNHMPQFVPEDTQFDSGNIAAGRRHARHREPQPARLGREPESRAHRRPPRAARQRVADRRHQHDSIGRHRARRDHHGRRLGRVRRRRARRRRQLRAQRRLRRRRARLPDRRDGRRRRRGERFTPCSA